MSSTFTLSQVVSLVVALLFLALYVVGFILCLINARLSRWLIVAGVGFLGQALMTLIFQLALLVLPQITANSGMRYEEAFVMTRGVTGFLSVFALGCILLGLGMAFADIRRQRRRWEDRDDFGRDQFARRDDIATVGPARPSAPGSEHIQQ